MTNTTHRLDDYDYHLPPEQIAQYPASQRDQSRLLVLDAAMGALAHQRFTDIVDWLRPGDLLVVNTTRVFPARLLGRKESGGRAELFLLSYPRPSALADAATPWQQATAPALIKTSKRPKPGSLLHFSEQLLARVDAYTPDGKARVTLLYRMETGETLDTLLKSHGQIPLPPYISRTSLPEDSQRYQTLYARHTGSVAAPTAGLHFSDELLAALGARGVQMASIVLHVGYGTFAPVRSEDIRDHKIHREAVEVSIETAASVNRVRAAGGRVWAVGTTTVRTLEFAADEAGRVQRLAGECDLFIYPGYRFRVVDNLITNFHLPKSSLLFLVSALAGRSHILAAYLEAVAQGYRFFSYGDAMAIVTRP